MSHIENGIEYNTSFLVSEKSIAVLEGKLLTLVEILGLTKEQSEALKSEIRQRVWAPFNNPRMDVILEDEMPRVRALIKELEEGRLQQSDTKE